MTANPVRAIPEAVLRRARAVGADRWIDSLPELVAELERQWSMRVGTAYEGGTEAYVAPAELTDGTAVVVKLCVPDDEFGSARNEIRALRLADGQGCVGLLRHDVERGAMLLERLGPKLHDLGLPLERRLEILCQTASRVWRPAPDAGLPTGAEKGRWLADGLAASWDALGRPCAEGAIDHALRCVERRIAAHDDARAVLVHGDIHQWNALVAGGSFKLVDPDGLLAEPEYDLGILMREDPVELLQGDPRARSRRLAALTGLDERAIWEWGAIERVSTGLLATQIELQPEASQMLRAAEAVAD